MDAHPVPEVREEYSGYTPPFDAVAVVRELLSVVPPEYMLGLRCVRLRNASGLSRRERRRSVPSRGKRYRASACRGFYHRPLPGHPAQIVLHVDRILQPASRLSLSVSVYRESPLAWTLYHELGHHIHLALHREHREPESVANQWADRLRRAFFRRKYPSLTREDWQRVSDVIAKLDQRRRRKP